MTSQGSDLNMSVQSTPGYPAPRRKTVTNHSELKIIKATENKVLLFFFLAKNSVLIYVIDNDVCTNTDV